MQVGVFGAGAIGGYLGIFLSAAGAEVVLNGRPHLVQSRDQLRAAPIGRGELFPGQSLRVATSPNELADVDGCLVTVKSRDTDQAGATLLPLLRPDALVISFQNGLDNAKLLARHLGPERVSHGVVNFNVFRQGETFRQATRGDLFAGTLAGRHGHTLGELAALFAARGARLQIRGDIERVVAGKLLLNLNNGVCAASGLGIAASLRSRDARWLFARCIREGIAAFRAADIEPGLVTVLPPRWIARLLMMPDAFVLTVARALASVDEAARSSTLQDLDKRRTTEIDELNGAIVALAKSHGTSAPANEAIVNAVHELERAAVAGDPLAFVAPGDLRRAIEG